MDFVKMVYGWLTFIGNHLQSLLVLVLRLYWGWQFFQTGQGKLKHLDQTAAYFDSLHLAMPKIQATMAGCVECFCGLFLLAGLASRMITIPLIVTMCVAYLAADYPKVANIFNDPNAFVTANPFLFLLTAVIVFVFGPGKFSVDYLLGWGLGQPNKAISSHQA